MEYACSCGNEGFDGETCEMCGYIVPPRFENIKDAELGSFKNKTFGTAKMNCEDLKFEVKADEDLAKIIGLPLKDEEGQYYRVCGMTETGVVFACISNENWVEQHWPLPCYHYNATARWLKSSSTCEPL